VKAISQVNTEMVARAASVVNQALVLRNWMVGAYIVEFEQHGADRAKYGANLLDCLASDMAAEGIKALSDPRVLRDCRLLYRLYPQIRGSLTRESLRLPNAEPEELAIRGSATRELPSELEVEQVLQLSWTKLQELIRIADPWQRAFYENECLRSAHRHIASRNGSPMAMPEERKNVRRSRMGRGMAGKTTNAAGNCQSLIWLRPLP
jgi:hypothetical protein